MASFRHGGGVSYAQFPRFQHLMAELSDAWHAALIDTRLPLVPGLVARLQAGIDVADIGCGQGRAINVMAQAFPNSRFVGYDFSEEAIALAQAQANRLGLTNARFVASDVTTLGVINQFDFVTAFDSIHDQAHPAAVLDGIATGLRNGGSLSDGRASRIQQA